MTEAKDELVNVEDDPAYTLYWSAIPEAMRWVVGDPIGEPISVEEFRDSVERNMAEVEEDVIWDDELPLSDVVGIIQTDDAETTASSLAIDLKAAAIYVHNESGDYIVGGSNVNSEGSGFFPWALIISDDGDDDDDISPDAARWTPRMVSEN